MTRESPESYTFDPTYHSKTSHWTPGFKLTEELHREYWRRAKDSGLISKDKDGGMDDDSSVEEVSPSPKKAPLRKKDPPAVTQDAKVNNELTSFPPVAHAPLKFDDNTDDGMMESK